MILKEFLQLLNNKHNPDMRFLVSYEDVNGYASTWISGFKFFENHDYAKKLVYKEVATFYFDYTKNVCVMALRG